ncbi:acyltransferase domain-containing protein [Serratia marcescens]|uniref:type I polyketide synthase n=1 Tax=Serratia marcescens TaxID=615 RepID=UPI001C55F7FF|nr:type I polyketide synthase [Serratia marcescens]QXX95815.1 acyltransferase domain-containing protein [Serratia marcescens]
MSESGIHCDKKIAIVGIACRFPGAEDLHAYWQLIKDNRIATRQNAPHALPADYCRRGLAGGFIRDVDQFDAEFFNISKREAQLMDPQQRLVLQHVWHAIEDASIAPQSLRGSKTGVFVGAMANDWAARSITDDEAFNSQMITGNGLALIANRVSYLYDLKGPSLSLDSACSSSLVALNYAAQALRNGDCDYALVAGVNVIATPTLHHFYQRSGIASAKGQCQPFSRYSDGIVRGEGVGVLLLQRVEDGAGTYALLEGCTLNHNGQSNGLSAPNRFSQQTLLTQTYQQWGISPAEIDYVECHGTGTELGDRIELQALNTVLDVPERRHPCPIGSVKGLIGHTEAAAGIAGVIKLALMLRHGYVPASLYADTPNAILEKNTPLKLPPLGYPLEAGRHLVAMSSFGLGGTNGHLVLRRPPAAAHQPDDRDRPQLFVLSAPTAETLADQARSLSEFLDNHPDCAFSALAAESRHVKSRHRVKKAWVASNAEELNRQLRQFSLNPIVANTLAASTSLYLTGNAAVLRGFSQALFDHYPPFRQAIERCDSLFYPLLGRSLITLMFTCDHALSPTQQNLWLPALFTWSYAQAELWASEGVKATRFIGEGVGEYVAAVLSGLLRLEEAVYLLTQHAEILHLQQVISGNDFQLEATAPYEKYQQYLHGVPERQPHTPFISCFHGRPIARLPKINAWLGLFSPKPSPGTGLSAAIDICGNGLILANAPAPVEPGNPAWISEDETSPDALRQHLLVLAQLYEQGTTLTLQRERQALGRCRLPPYRFQTARFWLDPIGGDSADTRPHAAQRTALPAPNTAEFVFATLASTLACEPQAIAPHMRLSEDLGLDSIVVIELLDILNKGLPEKHKLSFTDTLTIATVADLNQRVATLLKNGSAVSEEKA